MTLTRLYTVDSYLNYNSTTYEELKTRKENNFPISEREQEFLDYYVELSTEFEHLRSVYSEKGVSFEKQPYSSFQIPVNRDILHIEECEDRLTTVCKIECSRSQSYQTFMNFTFSQLNGHRTLSFEYNESTGDVHIKALSRGLIVKFDLLFSRLNSDSDVVKMRILCDSNQRNEVYDVVRQLYRKYDIVLTNCYSLTHSNTGSDHYIFLPASHIIQEEVPVLIESLRCKYFDVVEGALMNMYDELVNDYIVTIRSIRTNFKMALDEFYVQREKLLDCETTALINYEIVKKYAGDSALVASAIQFATDILKYKIEFTIGKRFAVLTLLHCSNVLGHKYSSESIKEWIDNNRDGDIQTVHLLIELLEG